MHVESYVYCRNMMNYYQTKAFVVENSRYMNNYTFNVFIA